MNNGTQDYEIFKGKTFGQLCKDIVTNAEEKKTQLDILVTDARSMVKTLNDLVTTLPLIKEYLEVGVRNDEQLIKLAAIIQRLISNNTNANGEVAGNTLLTDEERKQLMAAIEEAAKPVPAPKSEKAADEKEEK